MPDLKNPLLIAGFEGWANALDVSKAMASYLIRMLEAKPFAGINPQPFYRYDDSRPHVNIESGIMKGVSPPGGSFYGTSAGSTERDVVILKAAEPNLSWESFAQEVLSLCEDLNIKTIITLGSMYDRVLHTDRIISGIASSEALLDKLKQKQVYPAEYQGPSAIHSVIHWEGQNKGFECLSLWCHCPYYLQGTTHFGLLSQLGSLLSSLGEFQLDTSELDASWEELERQIQKLIEKNPEIRTMIDELKEKKSHYSWQPGRQAPRKDEKVISIEDFLKSTK